MIGVGIGLFFGGYTLLAYGWSQIHGANASVVQLVWPGSYQGPNLDAGSSTASKSGVTAEQAIGSGISNAANQTGAKSGKLFVPVPPTPTAGNANPAGPNYDLPKDLWHSLFG